MEQRSTRDAEHLPGTLEANPISLIKPDSVSLEMAEKQEETDATPRLDM